MPFSGGTYSRVFTWATEALSPPIAISKLDTQEEDIASALSSCLLRDGTGLPTATIDWNAQRLTNLGAATAATDAVRASQIQGGALLTLGSVAGTDTITGNLTPALAAYVAHMVVKFTPANNNTGAATLAINALAALDVQKADGDALIADDLVAGIPAVLVLDTGADDWILLNPQASVNGIAASDLARLSQANTFTASQTISAATPAFLLDETGADSNERFWRTLTTSGQWALQTRTDAGGAGNNAILIARTGTTVDSINLLATAVQVNGDAIVGPIAYGTYTPTLVNGANVASSVASTCRWTRIGSIVTVSGQISVDPTAAANTTTIVGVSLPVASNLGTSTDLSGVATWAPSSFTSMFPVRVIGDATADNANFSFPATLDTSNGIQFVFTYLII